jgi:serpin B
VKQKTFVEVNEEGTEAAAVTSVGVVLTSVPVIQTVRFDQPFLFVIRENLSGLVLFVGVMNDPSA